MAGGIYIFFDPAVLLPELFYDKIRLLILPGNGGDDDGKKDHLR
jgi:hypothetical protein